MNTGKAVLLSAAIVAAMLGAVGGGLYLLDRRIKQAGGHTMTVPLPGGEAGKTGAPRGAKASASRCGQDDGDDCLAKAALAPAAPALERSRRAVARIALEPMAADELKASKVGGRAYWAAGREYPRDPQGRPMSLLAQIDLAAAPKMPGYPERGLLQFFISGDDYYGAALDAADRGDRMRALAQQKGFRVAYWADASAPALAPPAGAASDRLPFDPAKPRRMTFAADYESIGNSDVEANEVLGGDPAELAERYLREHPQAKDSPEELTDQVADYLDRGGHKLGGHPQFTQSDPRESGDRRVLLFQLDSDDEMMWGDSGIANFFIDPDDLARADFSRVSYHWDCY
ncbi:YwqG family protein [Lysobacter yananisis]|uniref:YwqG family protein n=1 Tax=Lysobacter yananisis TaxID=1003114 RepID=A0ABY9P7N8_9GAMM|nr:YwqG family protein [Lysobacter yananisis]WMT03004.1 YwqG family protein [Lysobacter yananisis]